ncbi:MAG: hypothetical protein ACI9EF_003892 [Pseudohongiellaceae bacterium]|jgi:hypothetical protein
MGAMTRLLLHVLGICSVVLFGGVVVAQAAAPADESAPVESVDPDYWIYVPDRPAHHWLDKKAIDPIDLAVRPEAYSRALESHGILFDAEAGSFSVRGSTIHDERTLGYPIEYLVVTEQGRTHEAVVLVRAQPSVVSACVEALGLMPGSPTRFSLKDPAPSEEELDSGLVSPWNMTTAGGPLVSITVSWLDDRGRPHDESLESLLMAWGPGRAPVSESGEARSSADEAEESAARGVSPEPTGAQLRDRGWIFTGSRRIPFRQGRKTLDWNRADVEGDVVAIYIDGREVCPFERNSLDGLQDSLYTLNTAVIPPARTPVSLTFRSLGRSVLAGAHDLDEEPEALTGDDQR